MATEKVEDWDLPLPITEDESDNQDQKLSTAERREMENINKLDEYVGLMSFKQVDPVEASERTTSLAKPKKRVLTDNAELFPEYMVPAERGDRLKRLAAKHQTIALDHIEKVIRSAKTKDRQKENILKRKEEIYYDLLTKLERQCRTQYLNFVLKKFSNFIAKLSTTMRIPPKLFDPYARMQRGIFCNILNSIGVDPTTQAAIYYNTKDCSEYSVCHKLSHALLSLIIKALDLSSTLCPDVDAAQFETDFKMDDYIKERLMRAAEKKILCSKNDKRKNCEKR